MHAHIEYTTTKGGLSYNLETSTPETGKTDLDFKDERPPHSVHSDGARANEMTRQFGKARSDVKLGIPDLYVAMFNIGEQFFLANITLTPV
jgi:hypothetical protein